MNIKEESQADSVQPFINTVDFDKKCIRILKREETEVFDSKVSLFPNVKLSRPKFSSGWAESQCNRQLCISFNALNTKACMSTNESMVVDKTVVHSLLREEPF